MHELANDIVKTEQKKTNTEMKPNEVIIIYGIFYASQILANEDWYPNLSAEIRYHIE